MDVSAPIPFSDSLEERSDPIDGELLVETEGGGIMGLPDHPAELPRGCPE